MRTGIEQWLLRHWYGTGLPPWYLRALEPVYRAAFQRIRKQQRAGAGPQRSGVPLVVIGNITAGGSGKTPLVLRLCQLALELELKPGIVTSGYGRQSDETLLVDALGDTAICGDEPVMLAQRTGVPVVVAKRRHDAIEKLLDMNVDMIISDDGLQQVDLYPDIEICVVDGERGLGNGHLIPAGPLRETAGRLNRVDHVVSNGVWAGKPLDLDVIVMHLNASEMRSLDDASTYPVNAFRQQHSGKIIHAIAGIGHPQRFFRMLERLNIEALTHVYPDHHNFTRSDFDSIPAGSTLIMTEKDAVKCRSLGLENAWYVPVETQLPGEFETLIKTRMLTLIKDRKTT